MKFPEILIVKPIDPFPLRPWVAAQNTCWVGKRMCFMPGLGVWGREKTQILFREGIWPLASTDLARADCTRWVSAVAGMLTQSWRHCPDSQGPPLILAETSQEWFPLMDLVPPVSPEPLEISHESMAPLFHPATGKVLKNGGNQRERCFPLNPNQATKPFQKGSVWVKLLGEKSQSSSKCPLFHPPKACCGS